MAYFDNAATTFPKPECVYSFMDSFYRNCAGSFGRTGTGGENVASLMNETRKLLKDLLRCPSKKVIFTPTATLALNMILQGIIKSGRVKNVYVSSFEHNAVTRILHHFEKENLIEVRTLCLAESLSYDFEKIRYQFDEAKPDLLVVSHVSNVIGLVSPAEKLFSLSKKYGAVTVLDMAQSAGLIRTNVGTDDFDFAVFAGHKTLYGPTGISGFVMKAGLDLPPVIFGGTGFDSANQDMPCDIPQKYEMGTMNVLGIAGLNASLKWIFETGVENLFSKEAENRARLLEIFSHYDFVHPVGNFAGNRYTGIVSVTLDGIPSDTAGSLFSQKGIAVRTGLQCAPLAHKTLGTFPAGTVRFSAGYFTAEEDFAALKDALEWIGSEI